jgi:hypothetical protein
MNKNTHGYMTVWYTKGIYVSFVNCFVVILPHHKNLLLLALTLVLFKEAVDENGMCLPPLESLKEKILVKVRLIKYL